MDLDGTLMRTDLMWESLFFSSRRRPTRCSRDWSSDVCSSDLLFGGDGTGGKYNDLWRYHLLTNSWTWMKGSQLINQPGVYGTRTVEGPGNLPGARSAYAKWKDINGTFWLFG